jgi:hypothetical protein
LLGRDLRRRRVKLIWPQVAPEVAGLFRALGHPWTAAQLAQLPDARTTRGRRALAFTPVPADTQTVTLGTAAVAVIIAALVGWYGRMWREREGDRSVTRTRAANAKKAVWKARGVIVVVGIAAVAAVYVWLHGGR